MKNSDRTIVLTTHHLEEVDELADRTAILSRGKLLAVGTNDFIKKNFGVGYHLTLSKKSNLTENSSQNNLDHHSAKLLTAGQCESLKGLIA